MIQLTTPTLAHASHPCPTSPKHYTHTAVLVISTTEVTNCGTHNFIPQDKAILRQVYGDYLSITRRIHSLFSTDPSQALTLLANLNSQLALAIE